MLTVMPLFVDSPAAKPWRELYSAALFETDYAVLPERIAEAERAVVRRARELAHASGDHIEEQESMDDAMYTLRALRNVQRNEHETAQHSARAA